MEQQTPERRDKCGFYFFLLLLLLLFFYFLLLFKQHSPHSNAASGTNKVCPLPEPSQVPAGDHPVKYSESDGKPPFPGAGKILAWNSVMAAQAAGCIFTPTGARKCSSLELSVLKAKCFLASSHLHGEAVAAIILLRWTITPHYILILFPAGIMSHSFSVVSLVYGSRRQTVKYMFGENWWSDHNSCLPTNQKSDTLYHKARENFRNKPRDFSRVLQYLCARAALNLTGSSPNVGTR